MKETRYFYVPDAAHQQELPSDEAMHAMRVLRLKGGDELFLMDGSGCFYRARVTIAATRNQQPQWKGRLHLAIAPTKMLDRIEWMLEKATEVGIDEVSFLNCAFSERKLLKLPRLEKIVISAVKQSRKAWKPVLHEMIPFKKFIAAHQEGPRYIAHCYDEIPRTSGADRPRGRLLHRGGAHGSRCRLHLRESRNQSAPHGDRRSLRCDDDATGDAVRSEK